MKATLRKMGNSHGVIIPKAVITQLGLIGDVEMTVTDAGLLLEKPRPVMRQGWAEASQALAAQGEDGLVWPELANEGDAALQW